MSIEGLKAKIGVEWEPRVCEIEKGMIRRFAQAIDDPNPLWQDEEYASKTRYGGIIAPPTFVAALGLEQVQQILASALSETSLHGGTELEYYQPVRAGDVVTATTRIADFRQRQGKMGRMTFVTYENQKGELVGQCRQMVINY